MKGGNKMESCWILPCNINIFDVNAHFTTSKDLYWGATSATKVGDTLFVYVGRPFSEIKYRCRVIETNISEKTIKESNVAFLTIKKNKRNFIHLRLEISYPEHYFSYSDLVEHGLVSVQSQMRISDELEKYIKGKEKVLLKKGEKNG